MRESLTQTHKAMPVEINGNEVFVPIRNNSRLVDYVLERQYLNDVSARSDFKFVNDGRQSKIAWLRIKRLPVSLNGSANYDMLNRWQSALSALHVWNEKLVFLLHRHDGETRLYLGLNYNNRKDSINMLYNTLKNDLPGIGLEDMSIDDELAKAEMQSIDKRHRMYDYGGAVTGLPSFRKQSVADYYQTLDKLASGLKDVRNNLDLDFSLIVVAEPINDDGVCDTISRLQQIGSQAHLDVLTRVTTSTSKTSSSALGFNMTFGGRGGSEHGNTTGKLVSTYLSALSDVALSSIGMPPGMLQGLFGGQGLFFSGSKSTTTGESETKDYLNKFAQYTERMADKHCERLRKGRNLGFWNAGVYVLSNLSTTIPLVTGMLRSAYSGEESYFEPIRTHVFQSPKALESIRLYSLVPLANPKVECGEWHVLGKDYQYVSTPVNTEELSIFASLPRKGTEGLGMVRNAGFAGVSASKMAAEDKIALGKIFASGEVTNNDYAVNRNLLTKHTLVTGSTGSGKTTTARKVVEDLIDRGVPVLVIEPEKDDWLRWAVEKNKTLPAEKQINLFGACFEKIDGQDVNQLMVNPFCPYAYADNMVDVQTHTEQVINIINSALPMEDVLPVIMEECINTYLQESIKNFEEGEIEQMPSFPPLEGVQDVVQRVLVNRGYSQEVVSSFSAALETRFQYLVRNKRGKILNGLKSTPVAEILGRPCVINLSRLATEKDQALIMSLLFINIYGYFKSAYRYDASLRKEMAAGKLQHLTVLEEAHCFLKKPNLGVPNKAQQNVIDIFSNMISTIRSYGEGLMIIDQQPSRLADDAVANSNYKIVHRLTSPGECATMAKALELRPDQEKVLSQLEPGEAVVYGVGDENALWIKVEK